MRLYLGVDGGQSSTVALIGDETGQVLGSGAGGPCNHVGTAEGRHKFTEALEECLSKACAQAELKRAQIHFEAACLGFSGGPEDKQAIIEAMIAAGKLVITTDALVALSGATAGKPGIVAIAGTGSIAFGRNAEGKTARAGGWGYLFGDEGSGFDLARKALRAALRFEEGWGPRTILHGRLLDATGTRSANDLMHRLYTAEYPRPRIASYAKLVDQAAREGDSIATAILHEAAQDLASIAAAVRRQLFRENEIALVAYIGGAFRSGILLERFRARVELEQGNTCQAPVYYPAAGALIEAYRAAGVMAHLRGAPGVEK